MLKLLATVLLGLCLFVLYLSSSGSDVVTVESAKTLVLGLGLSGMGTIVLSVFFGGLGGGHSTRVRYNSQAQRSIPSHLQSSSRVPQQRPLPERPMRQRDSHNNLF